MNAQIHQTEEWRDVPGYPGYQVSSLGRVRSNRRGKSKKWRILKHQYKPGEYIIKNVRTYEASQLRQGNYRIHQLVALAFLGDPPPDHVVHHKDGNRSHNWVTNLEYKHKYTHISDHVSQLTAAEKEEVRYLYLNHEHDIQKLADIMGVSFSAVKRVIEDLYEQYAGEHRHCRPQHRKIGESPTP